MQFVLCCEEDHLIHAAADISRVHETADIQVLHQSRFSGSMLVEFDGSSEELRHRLDGFAGWIVSESCTYRLS